MYPALTDLSFLNKGEPFPPLSQRGRLIRYADNEKKFYGKLAIDEKEYNRVLQLVGKNIRVVSYTTIVNFYRLVSEITADLIFIEHPDYKNDDEKMQETINDIVNSSKLNSIGYEGVLDVDTKGVSILTAKLTGDGESKKGIIGVSNPAYWFPIVSPDNVKEIIYHVLAWVVTSANEGGQETKELRYQIHEKGSYTEGAKVLDAGYIQDVVGGGIEEKPIKTGFDDFAIVNIDGTTLSSSIFALDNYSSIDDPITAIQVRISKIAHVLDKHSDPSMAGPSSAVNFNEETGEATFVLGGFFIEEGDDKGTLRYVEYDGKLESSFEEIRLMMNFLAMLSQMGAVVFDFDGDKMSGGLSGKALRLLYTSALAKARRIRNNFDTALKHLIPMVSQVGYKTPVTDLSITWHDGLPNDPKEDAEIAAIRTGGKATDSQVSQIRKLDGVNEKDAQARLVEINEENKARMSTMPTDDTEFFETE